MNPITIRIIAAGLLFLVTLSTGLWLSRIGRPLNGLIFTAHKLIALGMVVLAASAIYQLYKDADAGAAPIGAIVISGLLIIGSFASGAWLSREKPINQAILTAHKLAPLLAAVSTALAVLLLTNPN